MKQRKNQTKKKKEQIQLQHYVSTDGDDIYVGKNNKQNDYLTNKKAKNAHMVTHKKIFLVHMSLYLMMHQVIRQSRKRLC